MNNPMMQQGGMGRLTGLAVPQGGVDPNMVPPKIPQPDTGALMRHARARDPRAFANLPGGMNSPMGGNAALAALLRNGLPQPGAAPTMQRPGMPPPF